MKVLLTTLHAKYSHASLALPCLAAACRDLPGVDMVMCELTVNEPREQLLRRIVSEQAAVVAFSCYIWNIELILKLASDIKKIAGDTIVVLGGPEASFGIFELMHDNPAVDYVVKGEGEAVFRRLLEELSLECRAGASRSRSRADMGEMENLFFRDGDNIASGPLARGHIALDSLPSPFESGLVDMTKPLIYYETSRGCPFSCAFCLSSVEGQVRSFSMERIKRDLAWLMGHKTSQIKLVDRTFNYDARRADQIWAFILENNISSHFHFEIAADLLTDENMALLQSIPPDTFRFEIGIQSTSSSTLEHVSRKADLSTIFANVRRLRRETNVELHLDLVAGLPEEGYGGVLDSLNMVAELSPHVIQIEPLKVLKGAPMREIARRMGYRYSDSPPYTILATPWLTYGDICRVENVGRLLDLFYNQGSFRSALTFMQGRMDFSTLLDRMAGQAANGDLAGRSTRRLYELFAELAGTLLPEGDRALLYDALFFDYCGSEMPLMGRLPVFMADRQQQCRWPRRQDLPEGLELPGDSRVKAFSFDFMKDYRNCLPVAAPVTITFAYVSGEGRGLKVLKT